MIERYLIVAARIRQELAVLYRVVQRTERAFAAARQHPEDQDLFLDAVALNLHDFYGGMERIFHHIAATLDRSVPSAFDWHRELLRQMQVELPQVRPHVLSAESVRSLDEFLRFRHVVRNIYAFEFDFRRLEPLTNNLRPCFEQVQSELLTFADFLEQLGHES